MLRALSKRPTSCAITSLQAVGADLPLYFDSMLLYLCIQADAYATLIPFFYKGRYHGQMGGIGDSKRRAKWRSRLSIGTKDYFVLLRYASAERANQIR